jgi:hypothetical protein
MWFSLLTQPTFSEKNPNKRLQKEEKEEKRKETRRVKLDQGVHKGQRLPKFFVDNDTRRYSVIL